MAEMVIGGTALGLLLLLGGAGLVLIFAFGIIVAVARKNY